MPSKKAAPVSLPKKRAVTTAAKTKQRKRPQGKKSGVLTNCQLPTEKKKPSTDIRDYSLLFYSVWKWGKTTLFSTFPDILFLSTEPGTTGLEIFEYNTEHGGITDWATMLRAVDQLEKSDQFENVVIDTGCESYRLAMEHVCRENGIEHPHDANDYGKTWNKVADQFVRAFKRIKQTGRGVYMTAHPSLSAIPNTGKGDDQQFKVTPNLSGQAGARVLALADFIFYGDFARTTDGKEIRIVRTRGNEFITAGARKIAGKTNLPLYIPLPEDESKDYEVFAAAFRGEDVGISAKHLMASKQSSKPGAKQVKKDRADALIGKGD